MKFIKYLGITLGIIYGIICIILFINQEKIIFNPEPLPESHRFRAGQEVEIPIDDDLDMNCLWMKEPNSKGVILYLHSNRGSIRFGIYQTGHLRGQGYDIFIPEYRGYGKTGGNFPGEKAMHVDVQKAYDYLNQFYREDQILVMGYSLGTAFATYVASQNKPKHLVLVAPFTSMADVKNSLFPFVPSFLLRYKFKTEKFIRSVKSPITIFHGMIPIIGLPEP